MKLLAATVAAAHLAAPSMVVRDVPLHAARTLAAAAPARFDMVGLHWRGSGSVLFRTRAPGGRWRGWRAADADPSPGERISDLSWTGAADAIAFRTHGVVSRLRAYYVSSPVERLPLRRLSLAGSPAIIPRLSWGANESIRRAPPQYAPAVRYAVIHHTAGSNAYTPAESAAIVRGIELYHVEGNGWNDIGYNFLVDRYGQVFEGRYGGIDRPVIGAHALGFNDGSVGIAVIGDYGSQGISAAARRALVRLLAWRLDVAHVDPLSFVTVASTGNPRFPRGVAVTLRAISGHRDTNFTDCPGNALYAELPSIARSVAALGLPKLYAPVEEDLGQGRIRFTGRLSGPLAWTVTVTDAAGLQVAQGTGTGPSVDWTWNALLAPPGTYTWTMTAAGARSAGGTLVSKVGALAIQKAAAAAAQVAPGETTALSYSLTTPALVTGTLVGPDGTPVGPLFSLQQPAGKQTVPVTAAAGLADGAYSIALAATAANGTTAAATVPLTIDSVLSGYAATPAVISSALHGSASISFTLARVPAAASLQVLRGTSVVATLPVTLAPGPQTLTWSGPAPDGTYTLALAVTDGTIAFTRSTQVVLDSTPPKLTALSARALLFRISEPATLTLTVGAQRYTRTLAKPGVTQFWLKHRPRSYTLVAVDAAGNSSSFVYGKPQAS